jgi:hypothetical protein
MERMKVLARFAPGFRDRIVGRTVRSTTQMPAYNPNYVGGDIVAGAKDIRQLVFGPRTTLAPSYSVGVPACTSARRRPHPARVCTACAGPTPRRQHSTPAPWRKGAVVAGGDQRLSAPAGCRAR